MIDSDRLVDRMRACGLSQSELGRRVKVSQATIAKLVTGKSNGSSHLHRIARELGTTPAYLTGETDDSAEGALPAPTAAAIAEQLDAVMVPVLDLRYAMGGGAVIDEPVVIGEVPFARAWLRARMAGTFGDLMLVEGEGDSMAPTILRGDMLLVDRAQKAVRTQDLIWAIGLGDVGMVKRLRRKRGGYEIRSDNPNVPPDTAADGEMEVVGRVIWIGRWQ